jgi:prepilin-type N-terminal cleavage/methylation domain-containing protein
MARNCLSIRRGFTLMELLIVIGIMIILASLVALVAPRMRESQKTTRGADLLQGWLFIAKEETYRDKLPRGVRLVRDANNPNWVRECQYIEQPEEYRGGFVQVPSPYAAQIQPNPPASPNNNVPANATAFITRQNIGPALDLANTGVILAGDFLTFDVAPYTTHRIYQATFVPQQGNTPGGTHLIFAAADYYTGAPPLPCPTWSPVPAQGGGTQIQQQTSFHIIRQARPRAGEDVLKLPKDIVIDLTPPAPQGSGWSQLPGLNYPNLAINAGDNPLDIIFNPRGGVMGLNASGGNVGGQAVGSIMILWIHDSTKPYPQGDQNFVAVYGRTGFIAAHPFDMSGSATAPYTFVLDGRNSGM